MLTTKKSIGLFAVMIVMVAVNILASRVLPHNIVHAVWLVEDSTDNSSESGCDDEEESVVV